LVDRVGHIHDEVKRLIALARGDAEPDLAVVRVTCQATVSLAFWQAREATPGSKTASSLTTRERGNQGDPIVGVCWR
jgi:hypothetical protein